MRFFVRGGFVVLDRRMREEASAPGDLVLLERGANGIGRNGEFQLWAVASEPAGPKGGSPRPAVDTATTPEPPTRPAWSGRGVPFLDGLATR